MNINDFIKREAPMDGKDTHDTVYAEALRGVYGTYKFMELDELKQYQEIVRVNYDSTHRATAACMVLYMVLQELINERI